MTTIADLVAATPAAARGQAVQIDYGDGVWRHVIELADPSAGASVVWYDITEPWCGVEYYRGAEEYLGRYRASVATLEVKSGDDGLAPWNDDTSPIFGTHVELGPGLLLRNGLIRVDGGIVVDWNPRFTCKVKAWGDASFSQGKIRRHTIVARDTMTSLVGVPIGASSEENWSERVAFILSQAGWPYGSLIYGATFTSGAADILTVPARPAASSAINELDATCDAAGLVWYTNRLGQLVIRPRVDDTFHAAAFGAGAAGTPWPDPTPVEFAWFACTLDPDDPSDAAAYAIDNQTDPFGLDKTDNAVTNHVKITYPVGGFDDDNPTSIQRHDRHTFQASWIAANDTVAAQILATGANATVEARPLHTAHDLRGFHPGPATVDFLGPVTVEHRNNDEGLVAYADGWLRHQREEMFPLGCDLDWRITNIVDVHTTSSDPGLLPVEGLELVDASETDAEFSWTNPTQTITPTHTQVRLMNPASLWTTVAYPITGLIWHGLDPATTYTFGVRLIRIVDGVTTHFSPIREKTFTTDPATVPIVDIDDDGDGTITFPDPGEVCGEIDWELQESDDGVSWSMIESGTLTDPPWTVDTSGFTFDPTKLYRVEQDVCGDVSYSNLFAGQCSEPPALAGPPFDDADLVAYWPAVCPPDSVREALSESPALHGPNFGLFVLDGDNNIVLVSDGEGTIVYGAAPGGSVAGDSDLTLACKVLITSQPDAPATLFGHSAASLDAVAEAANWAVQSRVQEDGAGITTVTDDAELDFGAWIDLAVTHDVAAGDLRVYISDGTNPTVEAVTALGIVGARTTPGTFVIGGPDGTLITNCAVWDRVLAPAELPGYIAPAADPSGGTITDSGGFRYHTFTANGTFDPGTTLPLTVDRIVVGGGGGGGCITRGGGGGGGEALAATAVAISTPQTVTIGAGGLGAIQDTRNSTNGGDTTAGAVTANGGGRGGGTAGTIAGANGGGNGGNGGGGGGGNSAAASGSGGTGDQKNGGAGNGSTTGANRAGGGGGGSDAGIGSGGSGASGSGGSGGSGTNWLSLGTRYGGGGGGSHTTTPGSGGGGGGGAGSSTVGANATGRGNGGGGGLTQGGDGSAGVVIYRYPWP